MTQLFVGYEVGSAKKVLIPIFHTLITGQTQLSGKSTLLKALAKRAAEQGYKILVLDTKTQVQDYESFGQEVPVCLEESTDSLILISLLESIFRRKITAYYATLTRISENASTFDDVIENAKILKSKARQGFVRDACAALIDLLKRLKLQTQKHKTTATLSLPYDINRMTINEFDLQGQQLIAKTVFEQALRKYKKLIIILDESYKFTPQKYSSACAKAIQEFVTQSGATECYLWMATQFLAPTNKDAMKTMAVKLLGTQDHDTEAQHTLDLIPFAKGKYDKNIVMRLKLGHFIIVTKQWVKTIYAVPEYADKSECKEVALGRRDPSKIHYLFSLSGEEIKELKKAKKPKVKPAEIEPVAKLEPKLEPVKPVESKPTKPPETEKKPPEPTKKPKRRKPSYRKQLPTHERLELLENNLDAVRRRIIKLEKAPPPAQNIDLGKTTTTVNVYKAVKHVRVTDETIKGKILTLAKKGFFKNWHPLRDVVKELEDHKWTVNKRGVQSELIRMSNEGLLGMRKKNRENYYSLSPNIIFED